MLQGRGHAAATRAMEAKGPRSTGQRLVLVFVSTFCFMTLYEIIKSVVFPAITLWQSHLTSMILISVAATVAASQFLRRLSHNEDTYRRLVETSPDAIWVHRQGKIIVANRACAELFGASSAKELLGKHELDFAHPRDHYAVRMRIQNQVDESNPVRHYETKYLRFDGKELDLDVVVCSILYQGAPASLVTFHDILERKGAEQKLRESEANLAAAQRIGHMGSWAMDIERTGELDTNPVRWSDEMFRIFGYQPGKFEPSRPFFLSRVHPDDRERISREMGRAVAERRGYFLEYRIIQPSGDERLVQGHVDLVFDEKTGKPLRFVGTVHDVTDQKRAEEKLAQWALVVESSEDAISSVTLDGKITSWNKGAERLYGYSASEAIGQPITILSPPDRPQEVSQFVERASKGESIPAFETVRLRKGGQPINVSLTISPVRDHSGKIVGTAAVARDITESKLAEERFYKAFHLNPEPITIATLSEGRYLDVNESFLQITGYRRDEVIGKSSMELKFWERPEDRIRLIDSLQKHGLVRDLEITFRTKSGEQRAALDSADIIDVNGERCVIAILKDITDRKGLEKQLRQLQKMEAIGQLSGGIAHDFNNLLGVILGYTELLEEGLAKNAKLRKTAQEIKKAGERASSLTRQLLAFSRQQVLEPRILNLNTVVADTGKMLRRLIGENIEITTKLSADLGQVKADQGQIEQVIMNLAVNARDAMPEGGKLFIETRDIAIDQEYALQHPPMAPGKYVELLVTDTGTGMDAQIQSHIFEPFFTTKELGKGTGLGLATVYGVVKQSGGYIWVYSEPGLGSTFKVYLPRVAEGDLQSSSGDAMMAPARGSETILLVEDEESLRTLTRTILEQNGYKVLEASGGLQAVEIAQLHEGIIDLLLTDMVMPGMNGRAVAEKLEQLRPGIKVVYMSGYSGFGHHDLAESRDILLSKPLTRDTLLRKLHEVLHLQKIHVF